MRDFEFTEKRHFTDDMQNSFAEATGDRNPMHVDPVAARRTQYGFAVVHGIHVLLWAADKLFCRHPNFRPAGLRAYFSNPVLVGDEAQLTGSLNEEGVATLIVSVSGQVCQTIRLTTNAPGGLPSLAEAPRSSVIAPLLKEPRALMFEEIDGISGAFEYRPEHLEASFPHLAAVLGATAVRGLGASTYIVGMECPGLHSIYSELTCAFDGLEDSERVHFKVKKAYARLRIVNVELWAPKFTALLGTFARLPPVQQPSLAALRSRVSTDAFAGIRALVIGGSRGLGEASAKLLGAGGAEVAVTYVSGQSDAERVASEIAQSGGAGVSLHYDARNDARPQLRTLTFKPNCLLYFATAAIYRSKAPLYDPKLMREFMRIYVDGFYDLCLATQECSQTKIVAFYPSTVFVETPTKGFAEYSAAKLAGEMICSHLATFDSGVVGVSRRLPRATTDQNATLTPVKTQDAIDIMLPILKDLHAMILEIEN